MLLFSPAQLNHGSQLLRIHYRFKQQGDSSRLFVCGLGPKSVRIERDLAWISMKRQQWFSRNLDGDDNCSFVYSALREAHPCALEIRVDRVTILRQGYQFLKW